MPSTLPPTMRCSRAASNSANLSVEEPAFRVSSKSCMRCSGCRRLPTAARRQDRQSTRRREDRASAHDGLHVTRLAQHLVDLAEVHLYLGNKSPCVLFQHDRAPVREREHFVFTKETHQNENKRHKQDVADVVAVGLE